MEKRVLVLRLSSLGDVVLTAPVYRNIKAHWPDAKISVLVKPPLRPVLEVNPHVDEVLVFRGLFQALREIRRGGFTHLLDLHANLRTFLLRSFGGIPRVAVYRKDALARRLYVLFRWASPALTKHSLDRYLDSLAAWGIPARYRDLTLGDYGGSGTAKRGAPSGKNVLLVQTSFLGDTLLTVPLAKRVKEVLPECRLTVLTRPQTAPIFRDTPQVDEVLEDDKRGADSGILGLWRLAGRLKDRGFDVALCAHRSFRSALLLRLAGIPRRIGFSSSAGAFLFHETVYFPWNMPELERNLALLLPLAPGLRLQREDSRYLGTGSKGDIEERLRESGHTGRGPLIGVHPGAVWPTKRWPAERFAEASSRLVRDLGATVLLIGGPSDVELCAEVARKAGRNILDWSGKTSLEELIRLMGRLDLLITNDSGPMHISAAHGVPTLAIFGPTTRELGFFPYGEGHSVLEADLACRPCGLHGGKDCPEGHFLCMRLIGTDRVVGEALNLLRTKEKVS